MTSLSRLIREPLLHFLVLGACLFVLFYQTADPVDIAQPNRIAVTKADVDRLTAQWQRQWRRPPTDRELEGLVDAYVREEILYREALALGLDQDDVIVRRRLGQKLEFLFKDLAEQSDPEDAELERFLAENAERYTLPGRLSFTHVYFNSDKRGAAAEKDARKALALLNGGAQDADPAGLGDRFLYQYRFDEQSPSQVARIFGSAFSDRITALDVGEWRGPIASGYGIHLVRVSERTEPRQPALAEVRDKVRWDVIAERREEIDSAFYEDLRERYEVTIDEDAGLENRTGGHSG